VFRKAEQMNINTEKVDFSGAEAGIKEIELIKAVA